MTVPGKDLIQNWWKNKKLFREAKVKRIQYHQTKFTTNVKGTYIVKKYNRRKKIYKSNPKQLRKSQVINNYFKCKWIKCSNQKSQTGWWIQNKTHIYAVYKKPTSDRPQDTYRLKVRGWKNIFHTNGKKRKLE